MNAPLIVVTGAAAGIGARLAERLVKSGMTVIGLDRMEVMPTGVIPIACDLASRDGVQSAAEQVREIADMQGPISGLAHVAGVPGNQAAATVLAVNFLAARELTALLANHFDVGASIVGVSSLAAQRCSWTPEQLSTVVEEPNWDIALATALAGAPDGAQAYEVSKRLLLHWVPATIAFLANKHMRVNTVSPGPVKTQMLESFRQSMGIQRIDAAERLAGRHAEADEIAAPIQFLLSSEATWISGVDLRADGGLHAMREWQSRKPASKGQP